MLRLERFAGEAWAAAGDAAAAMDPLAAHGITTALWSGRRAALAARALLAGDPTPLEDYAQDFEQGWSAYARQLPSIYEQVERFRDTEFWRRRWQPVVHVRRQRE